MAAAVNSVLQRDVEVHSRMWVTSRCPHPLLIKLIKLKEQALNKHLSLGFVVFIDFVLYGGLHALSLPGPPRLASSSKRLALEFNSPSDLDIQRGKSEIEMFLKSVPCLYIVYFCIFAGFRFGLGITRPARC